MNLTLSPLAWIRIGFTAVITISIVVLWFQVDYYKARGAELSKKVQQLKGEIEKLKFESQNQSDATGANHEIESNRTIVIRPGAYSL